MSLFRKAKPDPAVIERALADDLDVLRDVLARYPDGTYLTFGAPCRCPDCGDYGLADEVNRHEGIVRNTCHSCGRQWVITMQALRAYRRDPDLQVRRLPELLPPTMSVSWSPAERHVESLVMRPLDADTARFASAGTARPPAATVEADPDPEPGATPAAPPATPTAAPAPLIDLAKASADDHALVVLVVDDNPFDLALIEELAGHLAPNTMRILHAPTLIDGLAAARFGSVDVVVLDLDLPDSSGLATMVEWQVQPNGAPPIVALVDHADVELIRGARTAGARQVVQKRHLSQLAEDPETGSRRLEQLLRGAARPLVSSS